MSSIADHGRLTVLCAPNLNRHRSMILAYVLGLRQVCQYSLSSTLYTWLHLGAYWNYTWHPHTCWRIPAGHMWSSSITKSPTIHDTHLLLSNVCQNQWNPMSLGHFKIYILTSSSELSNSKCVLWFDTCRASQKWWHRMHISIMDIVTLVKDWS